MVLAVQQLALVHRKLAVRLVVSAAAVAELAVLAVLAAASAAVMAVAVLAAVVVA